jgi:hypothetical protein
MDRPDPIVFETLPPSKIQQIIKEDPEATARLFRFIEARGERHAAELSGGAMAAAAGTDGRNWRRWVKASQTSRLRWLHPILVGAGETVPTIHK